MNLKAAEMPKYMEKKCPFCFEDLGKAELMKRKLKKNCVCKNCGRAIDERNVVW